MNHELVTVIMPDGTLRLEWTETRDGISEPLRLLQDEIYKRYTKEPDDWLLFLAFCDNSPPLSPSLDYWRSFAQEFGTRLTRLPDLEAVRDRAEAPLSDDDILFFWNRAPMMIGAEYMTPHTLKSIWNLLNRSFAHRISAFEGTVAAFLQQFRPDVQLAGRVYFHLVENREAEQPFAFLATYSTRLDDKTGKSQHLPLSNALKEFGDDRERLVSLLSTVYKAAEKSELVADLIESGELFHPLAFTAGDAYQFLKEIPIYESAGILCRIPNWWKAGSASISMNVNVGPAAPAFVGMDAILNIDVKLMVGDMEISEAEARALVEGSEGLAFIKNRWVAVDEKKLEQTLSACEKARKLVAQGYSLREALRMQLMPEKHLGVDADEVTLSVSSGQWLRGVMEKLSRPDKIPDVEIDPAFRATLRGYQAKGVNWLHFLHSLGFGACLADDMGLGKTVQLLGFLGTIHSESVNKASLLVLPASLIANWANEIEKFYPTLKVFVAHPDAQPSRIVPEQEKNALDKHDLVITTYGLVQRYEWIQSYAWRYIILDEAQAIKNPGTKQTRAIKALKAENRIIMTGTPIENRLGDLWSLFDFLNPGLLGRKAEFTRFTKGLKDDPDGYARLRRVVRPYVLRRLKTDGSIISDLPEKVEMKTYAQLSKRQVVLYKKLVEDMKRRLAEAIAAEERGEDSGIQRRGLVLATLIKLKQLCNHPDQYQGSGAFKEAESGKFERLRAICQTIYEKREQVLVFTQFREMAGPLADFLETIFERKGSIVHGGVTTKKRQKIIEEFQDDSYTPFMILSLKAGGVGLNLTKANHVIHFDRWWNPAVENQATDRAFRIGQQKNVLVHKFITRGTVEEKIDRMIDEKRRLSDEIIAETGEKWITEMNPDELADLFSLSV